MISAARNEAKTILEMAKKQIEQETKSVRNDLKKELVPIAFSIAEKILEKNIDRNSQSQLVEKFLADISEMKQ